MTEDEQLKNCFEGLKNKDAQAQLRWCTVTSVDKEKRLMDALGKADGLEYYDIQLGIGSLNFYPKQGSLCLIALIEGQETDAYLLSASEVESVELTAGKIALNGGDLGGMVMVKELTEKVNAFIDAFNQHTHKVFTKGSAATQEGTAEATTKTAQKIKQGDIENKKVTQ